MAKGRTPKCRLRVGDIVTVIAGENADSDKTAKVLRVDRQTNRAVVEGVNLVKKHIRKSQDYPQGGIIEKEAPIHISNLRVVERGSSSRAGS